MTELSGEKLHYIKQAALAEAAAFVAARESGAGFYFPYINLVFEEGDWVIEGNTVAQFQNELPPPLVDWAMSYSEQLSIVKSDDFDPELGDENEVADKAKIIIFENRTEIINLARELVSNLFQKHGIVGSSYW